MVSLFGLSLAFLLATRDTLAVPVASSIDSARNAKILEALAPLSDPRNSTIDRRTVYPVSAVSSSVINSYNPYTHLAAASYCATASVKTWACGTHCAALPGMVIYAAGGDNESIPDWYVGYLPSLASAVVVHQGTTPGALESDYVDIDYSLTDLNPAYFPGVSSSVQVHEGFAAAHGKTFPTILAAVKKISSEHQATKITTIGHSLGGAIAVLDAMSLQLSASGSSVTLVTYGQPRVGNQDFANYVDAHLSGHVRITHDHDPVPTLPGRFLGFVHSSGETHIGPDGTWWACSGQDNTANPQCSTGEVPYVWDGEVADHDGPYAGIMLGVAGCT